MVNWIWNKLLTKECVVPLIGIIVILLLAIWMIKDKNQQSQEDTMTEFIEIPDNKGNVHHFHRHDLESYRDGYFNYNPQGGFYTPLTAKEIKAIIEKPSPPADDALVEAVKLVEWINKILHHPIPDGVTYSAESKIIDIEAALHAHKQAGE